MVLKHFQTKLESEILLPEHKREETSSLFSLVVNKSEETSLLLQHSTSTSSVLSASAKEFVPSRQKTETISPAVVANVTAPVAISDREDSKASFLAGEGCEAKQVNNIYKSVCITNH